MIMQYIWKAMNTGNIYDLQETISSTYTIWVLMKQIWTNIVVPIP